MPQSKRIPDPNGWYEVRDNPISKVGIFEYYGREIQLESGGPPLEPDKIYRIFRPEKELNNPDTINSFKLKPLFDTHGQGIKGNWQDGLETPEDAQILGTIGEQVYFKGDTLYGNIVPVAQIAREKINANIRDLSPGYRCRYRWEPGSWQDQPYDIIQYSIKGNHLAIVEDGRTDGVHVLDHNSITEGKTMTLEELMAMIAALSDEEKAQVLAALAPAEATEPEPTPGLDTDPENDNGNANDADPENDPTGQDEGTVEPVTPDPNTPGLDADPDDDKSEGAGMDAKTVRAIEDRVYKRITGETKRRDQLAGKLSQHVGAFDHNSMTVDQVIQFGAKKLGLKLNKGNEALQMEAILNNRQVMRQPTQRLFAQGLDSSPSNAAIDNYLDEVK